MATTGGIFGLYIKSQASGIWYYDFRFRRKRYQGSTGETVRRRAEEKVRAIRASVEATGGEAGEAITVTAQRQDARLTLADVAGIEIDRVTHRDGHAQRIDDAKFRFSHLLKYFTPDYYVDQLNIAVLEAYVASRRAAPTRFRNFTSDDSIRRELGSLKRGLLRAVEIGRHAADKLPGRWPTFSIEKIQAQKCNKRAGQAIPPNDVLRWLAALPPKAAAQAAFAAYTGLRGVELSRVQRDWITAPTGTAMGMVRMPAWATKTKTPRDIPLPPAVWRYVKVALVEGVEGPRTPKKKAAAPRPPFAYRYHVTFKRVGKRLGLARTPHLRDLRHTFITELDYRTHDKTALMKIAGHKTDVSHRLYKHSTLDREAALGALADNLF